MADQERSDTLRLAELHENGKLRLVDRISGEGVTTITQPCLTRMSNGRHLCVWSQLEPDGQWDLMGRVIGPRGKAAKAKAHRSRPSSSEAPRFPGSRAIQRRAPGRSLSG